MIDVMIVDDSGFMRLAIKKMLEKHDDINIVAEASSADDAIKLAISHRPHIITMDIEMPGLDGIEATKQIMEKAPAAIIMVSSLTNMGADATIKALNQGAVDFIPKASSFVSLDIANIEKDLTRKIYYWYEHGKSQSEMGVARNVTISTHAVKTSDAKPRVIVIGASTGGPKCLPELFSMIGKINVPIIIALHMPAIYTESFAQNMTRTTGHKVVEGKDNMLVEPGMIVVAPGGKDTLVQSFSDRSVRLKVVDAQQKYTIHPSVDALFLSAVTATKRVAAVVLTGMGDDGLEGAYEFKKYGIPLIAQSKKSCLVYGMPRAVAEAGLASQVLDLDGIARKIQKWAGTGTNKLATS